MYKFLAWCSKVSSLVTGSHIWRHLWWSSRWPDMLLLFEWCHLELKWLQLFSKAFHLHLTFQLGSVRWRRRPRSNQSAAEVAKLLGRETGLQNTKTIRNRMINHDHHTGHEHDWGDEECSWKMPAAVIRHFRHWGISGLTLIQATRNASLLCKRWLNST